MMASFNLSTVPTAIAPPKNNSSRLKTHANEIHCLKVARNATQNNNKDKIQESSNDMQNVDRRNMILGLGSLFVTANLSTAYARASDQTADTTSVGKLKKVEDMEFPLKLDKRVQVLVKRPAVNRTKEDKKKANEILMVNGIRFDAEKYVKFDVLVDDEDNGPDATPAQSEFVGSFAMLPRGTSTEKTMMTSGARFGLTELLEDIKAEDDEYVCVTLVPQTGTEDVTISEIKIELVPIV